MGIIRALKAHYRKNLVNKILTVIDTDDQVNASELAKKVNLLEAQVMLKEAWDSVSATCIINCFRKAGFKKEINPDSLEENNPSVENDLHTPPPDLSNEEFSEFVDIDEDVESVYEQKLTGDDIF